MMHCVAIDDEPLALRQIVNYIEKTPFLELAASCHSALEAMKVMSENRIDLLFVDINMPDLNGMEFVRSLTDRPIVIFTTAYSEYAIEGFRVDAVDYLLKPISYPDFLRSAEKARRQFRLEHNAAAEAVPDTGFIFVKSEYKTVRIATAGITHIESRGEYVRIYPTEGQPVMTLGSLRSFEESLPSSRFMRVHRSYIVNLDHISAIERKQVIIGKDVRITIGESYEEEFRKYLEGHIYGSAASRN